MSGPPPSFVALRLSLFYAACFAVIGVQQPFWPLWLASNGLTPLQIAILLALSIGVKVMSAPVVAHLADRTGERRRLMILCAILALGSFAMFGTYRHFLAILLISLMYFAAWPPTVSLAESLSMHATRLKWATYGRVRLWGSLSFIATAGLAGQILSAHPAHTVYWMIMILQALVLISCIGVPDLREEQEQLHRLPLIPVLRQPFFVSFLSACGLIQGSHAVYYAFATLTWKAAGYSEGVIGLLWAEAVLAEVVFFAYGYGVVRTVGPLRLIGVAGVAAALRWIGTGLTTALPVLVGVQLLHGLSFGAAHLAAMHYITKAVAPSLSTTAQSLYAGLVWGAFLGLGLLAAGFLYETAGIRAFLPMTAAALAGSLVSLWLARRVTN